MPALGAPLIDVHHHGIPAGYLDALDRVGVHGPVPGIPFPAWSVDSSLETMELAGIATAVLSITAPGLGVVSGGKARAMARDVNEWFAEIVRAAPQRFGAFALLPLDDVDAAITEAAHALDDLGLDGVGLFTSAHGRYLGDPELDALFDMLADRSVPAFVHPTVPSNAQQLFGLPASVVEFPLETTRAVTSLLFSGTLDRHPDLKLIISHAGGAVPFLARRMTFASMIDPTRDGKPPADLFASLRRLYYDVAMSASPEQLTALRSLCGADQIVFGSDYPFMPAHHAVQNAQGLIDFDGWRPGELERVARVNAAALLPRLDRVERPVA